MIGLVDLSTKMTVWIKTAWILPTYLRSIAIADSLLAIDGIFVNYLALQKGFGVSLRIIISGSLMNVRSTIHWLLHLS
jgi:hypothetical protein